MIDIIAHVRHLWVCLPSKKRWTFHFRFGVRDFLFSDDSISWPVKIARVGGCHARSETVEIVCSTMILSKFSLLSGVVVTPAPEEDMRLSLFPPPRMNVLMPVIVARGIWGKWSISSLSDWSIFRRRTNAIFLLMYQCRLRIRSSRRRDSFVMKKDRNAERDTMITAVQASTCCQNITHTVSFAQSDSWIFEIRMIAMIIMKIERHKVVPKISFWRRLIWMRHSRWNGIISTKFKADKFDVKHVSVDTNVIYLLQYLALLQFCETQTD